MPDPIEAPYLNWDTPNPADRVFESNPSRAAKDREEFMAELERHKEKHQNDHKEDSDKENNEDKQDTFERSYTMNPEKNKVINKSKEDDNISPGQVIDLTA